MLSKQTAIRIKVQGLVGSGAVRAAVNVGSVDKIEELGGNAVQLSYQLPEQRSPQVLCLAVWREPGGRVQVARIPMEGRTVVPVSTRPHSQVTVEVGRRLFGPNSTGDSGTRRIRLLVPPGVTEAIVHVKDNYGLESQKKIQIEARPYRQVTVAVAALSAQKDRFEVTVATAEVGQGNVRLEIGGKPFALRPVAPGIWSTPWTPGPDSTSLAFKAWIPGAPGSTQQAEIQLRPARAAPAPTVASTPVLTARAPAAESGGRRVRGVLALAIGMLHNTGALISPRFTAEAGLDFRLARIWIGLRLFAGVAWGHLGAGEVGPVRQAAASVLLVPLGGGLAFSLPLTHVTPYVMVGFLGQIVRARVSAELLEERLRYDAIFGIVGVAGVERRLGPGSVFLQVGGQWSKIENADLKLLAGGVVLEGGYRFSL